MPPKVVLVTGLSRVIGSGLAARLAADPEIERVLGVDTVPPTRERLRRLGRVEFVRADIRNPLISKVIATAKVDTVVHASSTASNGAGGRVVSKEMNVIGTMQLLAACQRSSLVQKLVLKSTGAVYGSSPRDPVRFTEDTDINSTPTSGFARDAVEIEGYVRGLGRRRPDISITTLRLNSIIGPKLDTPLSSLFTLPVVPMPLGFDARLQLLHVDDAIAVLERATREDLPGVYNVAGSGILTLTQAIRRSGRVPLPTPTMLMPGVGRLLRNAGLVRLMPDQIRYLNFGSVLDTTRLRGEFGFSPRWTTAAAFDDFLARRGQRPLIDPDWLQTAEDSILDAATRLR
ncbi:NAD-dependent epimerase/dehydratase family protein [Pseudonocardiaceae bacterium YIM PH 21723]|nr:NAD-dependent epimerase/dehydratase family protein [Pseudonocardiaceae bacterium YIM PH 21723]